MEMLELQDLHKTFNPGTVNEKVALNGVSLKMEAGDFATIVGSNGRSEERRLQRRGQIHPVQCHHRRLHRRRGQHRAGRAGHHLRARI